MRSSKSRSRSKANRPRTLGNIVNRVFDSSGPEGKVRGTPQQIIEKYQMLAGDAQRSNDRVAAENFSQHAEHYTRMLAEAMREMAAEQESRQQYQQSNQNGNRDRPGEFRNDRNDYRPERGDQPEPDQSYNGGFAAGEFEENGLVELPEANRQPSRRDDVRRDEARRDDNRRDDRPRENRGDQQPRRDEQNRNDPPRSEQPRREDQPRAEQPRRFENRRDDRPRDDRPREPRPAAVTDAPVAPTPVVAIAALELPRFESPAALVAQVEQAAAAAPTRARAPKSEAKVDAVEKTTRAPRARKPAAKPAPEGDKNEAAE